MDWLAFLGSILGGLIGGLFTFFGVKATLRHEDKKMALERLEKAKRERPRLEIVSHSGFKKAAELTEEKSDWDVVVLGIEGFQMKDGRARFYFDEAALKLENLTFVEYELINSGLTEIEDMIATCNLPQNIAIFELDNVRDHITEKFLNYESWAKKPYVKPKQTIKLRVYYIKNKIVGSTLSSPILTLWLKDVNGYLWSQCLYAPREQLDNSEMRKNADLKDARDWETAIKCFKGELPW